jgi:hypothetical protein
MDFNTRYIKDEIFSGLTPDCAGALYTSSRSERGKLRKMLTDERLDYIKPSAFSGFMDTQIYQLSGYKFKLSQLSVLTPNATNGLIPSLRDLVVAYGKEFISLYKNSNVCFFSHTFIFYITHFFLFNIASSHIKFFKSVKISNILYWNYIFFEKFDWNLQ